MIGLEGGKYWSGRWRASGQPCGRSAGRANNSATLHITSEPWYHMLQLLKYWISQHYSNSYCKN